MMQASFLYGKPGCGVREGYGWLRQPIFYSALRARPLALNEVVWALYTITCLNRKTAPSGRGKQASLACGSGGRGLLCSPHPGQYDRGGYRAFLCLIVVRLEIVKIKSYQLPVRSLQDLTTNEKPSLLNEMILRTMN